MNAADSRVRPLVPVDPATIQRMCAPIAGGEALGSIASVNGGLVNTLYRVITSAGEEYAVRVSTADTANDPRSIDLEVEVALLRRLTGRIPVPLPVVVSARATTGGHPYMIYPWIHGITLNECRRSRGTAALAALADPVGRLAASIATTPDIRALPLPRRSVADALIQADALLDASRARDRLGPGVANAFRDTLGVASSGLRELDEITGLAHHDFSGRNIIVRECEDGTWDVQGVIDWETACIACPLWDVGSLFRYARRYDADFRSAFEKAYRKAGGALPDGWWHSARLLDATRLVGVLSEDRDLPSVFEDCRSIVESLI